MSPIGRKLSASRGATRPGVSRDPQGIQHNHLSCGPFAVEPLPGAAEGCSSTSLVRFLAVSLRLLLYEPFPAACTISSGSQRSREGYIVIRSTKEGARDRRNRTRAAITTAAALIAAAALAGPAHAAVSASADDPNTTLPASFTDSSDGLAVGLCADGTANCSSIPPDPNAPVSTANFDPSGEAFWMLANASFTGPLSNSVAEFALEAAFLG